MEGQTNVQTDILPRHSPHYAYVQRWRQRGGGGAEGPGSPVGNSGPSTRIHKVVMDCWKYCKWYNFALSLHVRELKSFQLQGGFAPADPLTRGSAPGPRCPQTPVIGSRSTRLPCAPPPKTAHGPLFQYSGTGAAYVLHGKKWAYNGYIG